MKNLFIAASAAAVLFALAACDEGPYESDFRTVGLVDRVTISDIEGLGRSGEVTDVAFVARFHGPAGAGWGSALDAGGNDTRVMLKTPFDAAGTTLTLPQNPPAELLNDVSRDFPDGLTISDPAAKTISFTEIACNLTDEANRKGQNFYQFFHMYLSRESVRYELKYVYCDRPATIVGETRDWWSHPIAYDLDLKKGWNMVIEKQDWHGDAQSKTVTHQMPAGMRWEQSMWL